jgi:hypothetical protein
MGYQALGDDLRKRGGAERQYQASALLGHTVGGFFMTKERDINEAMGFEMVDGEADPIFDITPEMEHEFYSAGDIGPEGLTMIHSGPRHKQK